MHTEGILSMWLRTYINGPPWWEFWFLLGIIQINLLLVQKLNTLREKAALNVVWGPHI